MNCAYRPENGAKNHRYSDLIPFHPPHQFTRIACFATYVHTAFPAMNKDLTQFLNDWPFEPSQINARVVQGADGEPKLQVRVDLGVLQMNLDGRPDGAEPEGFGSVLELFESRFDLANENSEGEEFSLSSDDCRALRDEAVQYYHRYVALMTLEDFDRVVRDTTRSLRVLDFCAAHAAEESDRTMLEQFRPYITMLRARALASRLLRDGETKAAVQAIDDGLEALGKAFAHVDEEQKFQESSEAKLLIGMREALVPKLPVSQTTELRQRLARALEQENYELAAILRDELRAISERQTAE